MMRYTLTQTYINTATDGDACNQTGQTKIVMYLNKQTNKTTAQTTDLFEDTTDVNTWLNLENSERFKILYDKLHTWRCDQAGLGSNTEFLTSTTKRGSCYKNMNLPIVYDNSASTGALATIRSNNIGIMVIQQKINTKITMDGKVRIRYVG